LKDDRALKSEDVFDKELLDDSDVGTRYLSDVTRMKDEGAGHSKKTGAYPIA
jgi:hypothetical protein